MDMTPMVDVAFLLLIFFMSTTQFKPPEMVAVRLPASSSEIHIPETNTILLTVTQEGRITVVVVKGDRDADFGTIAELMDALGEAKTLRFNLMTDFKRPKDRSSGN
jgi:biopolymer transport protein ExbD